ncbi:MAG: leucine-rich repeat domain-containing protein [Prevotella sp.]|nr:leucine-rich repeat domain-containing protein [Prevotella sp.]
MMALLVSSTMAWAEGGTCGTGVTWDLTDGTLTISGTGAMYNYDDSDNKAPWYSNKDDIDEIVIENGVTSIGDYAFNGCTDFWIFNCSSTVTSIGSYAFKGCNDTGFSFIVIPASVKSVGANAFNGCTYLRYV